MKKYLYFSIVVVSVITFFIFYHDKPVEDAFIYSDEFAKDEFMQNSTDKEATENKKDEEKTTYLVYITGCVNNPNVYEVSSNSRIIDVIKLAGGSTSEADLERINLAQYVEDAQHIIIPNVSDNIDKNENTVQNNKVNINKADKEKFMEITGIGESLADDIINYRNNNGNFITIDDIKNVSGIGDKMFEKFKDEICVN